MGKVSKTKKRERVSSSSAPYSAGGSNRGADKTSVKLLTDMKSIDYSRRLRACQLLGALYSNSSTFSRTVSLDALASDEVLGLLRLRLLDSHPDVRTAATLTLRYMGSCKDQTVYSKLERCGIAGTVLQLVRETFGAVTPDSTEYVESLVAALHSLCVWGESIVRELSSTSYLQGFLVLAIDAPSPKLVFELTGLVSVLMENNPSACAVVSALVLPSSESGLQTLVRGMVGQWASFRCCSPVHYDLRGVQLNCAGALCHFLAVADNDAIAALDACAVSDSAIADGGSPGTLAVMLSTLIKSINLTDEIISDCMAADVPIDYSSISAAETGAGSDVVSMDQGEEVEVAHTSNSRPEGSEDVIIGAEAVERISQSAFGIVRLAVEVLGNFALVAKERMNKVLNNCSSKAAIELEDWSAYGEDEGERLMDHMASSMAAAPTMLRNSASVVSATPFARLFSEAGVMVACCNLLTQLHSVLFQMALKSRTPDLLPLPSSVLFVLETMEIVMLCIGNMSDYSLIASLDTDAISLASLLIACGQLGMDVLFGVSPSSMFETTISSGTDHGKSTYHEWELSPCLDSSQVAHATRQTIVASAQAIASLFSAASDTSKVRPVSLLPSPGLLSANISGVSDAVPTLVACLLRFLHVPIMEVNTATCELISCVAGSADSLALSQNENMVLTNALLKRISDPLAISIAAKGVRNIDTSLAVSAACYSALVDLHSSDEAAYLEVFSRLNVKNILSDNLATFRSKMQVDGATIDREELLSYKETYLNVKRFLKYKSNFV